MECSFVDQNSLLKIQNGYQAESPEMILLVSRSPKLKLRNFRFAAGGEGGGQQQTATDSHRGNRPSILTDRVAFAFPGLLMFCLCRRGHGGLGDSEAKHEVEK